MLLAFLSTLAVTGSHLSAIPSPLPALDGFAIARDYWRRGRFQTTIVEFVARGSEWGDVWIDGTKVFAARNFNRTQTLQLFPGAYRIVITGMTRLDVWASGYLDVGQTNVIKFAFSKDGGVEVAGDRDAWLPDDKDDPNVWRR